MTSGRTALCEACARRLPDEPDAGPVRGTCEAFPRGIPIAIWAAGHDHRLPFPGDGGLRFILRSGYEEVVERFEREGGTGRDLSVFAPHARGDRPRWFDRDGHRLYVPATLRALDGGDGGVLEATWPLDPKARIVIVVDAPGTARIAALDTGDQPESLGGWLLAEALRELPEMPDRLVWREGLTADPRSLLSDAAEDLDADIDWESGNARVGWLRPWPSDVVRW